MDEVILIDKPQGMTSFGVVARLRRVLSNQAGKKVKVGHTGTLDPFATGLMIIVTGKKCREAEAFTKLDNGTRRKLFWARIVRRATQKAKLPKCLIMSRVWKKFSR